MTVPDDAIHPADAASVLGLLLTRPRLLAVGEPTHREDALLDLRNDLFRELVEDHGYGAIAIETDCLRGLVVDDHVTTGAGTLDEVMATGFSHEWGASAANRALVRWMRSHNEGRPAPEQVRFAGFDGPLEITAAESPRQPLLALHAFLGAHADADLLPCTADDLDRLLGADDRWVEPAAMMDASRSCGRSPDAARLRLLADDLVALLDAQAPQVLASSSRDGLDRARLHGRAAVGLLRYHAAMADPSPARLARMLTVRDSMMAGNLLALAERGPTMVHAHNAHLQRPKSSMRMGDLRPEWWSAGAIVGARLGEAYAFVPTALGTIVHQGVDAPPPDTLEGILHAIPGDRALVDPRRLGPLVDRQVTAPRVSAWFGYAPLDPDHLPTWDGILYVRDCPTHP